jgi:polysaccharide pyruvyl transferase WcaK-like protein
MDQIASAEVNPASPLTARRPIRRVALLSPTSGNLGNAAMQAAMIANLRKRIAGVEILGITLNPEETRRRHGIEAFPLAGVSRPYYGVFNSDSSKAPNRQTPKLGRIKRWLKKIPVLRSVLRFVRTCAIEFASRWCKHHAINILGFVRTCGMELAHIRVAARVVRRLDCIIIPGGGTLDDFWGGPWGQPWALFKWSVLSRVLGVPFLLVSIGKCSLESPLSRFFARIGLRCAEYRSYRDPASKSAVQALIDARRDPVYPDLAFSYPCSAIHISHRSGPQEDRLVVGVSPIAYCDPRVWPRKDERRYAAYVSQLAEVVRWLVKGGHRVLFFTTDGPDVTTLGDVQTLIASGGIGAEMIEALAGSPKLSPDGLLRGISRANLVIASRLHGVILSHLSGIPVLALSFDPKVDAHMNVVGQQDYCLSIDHLQFDTIVERFNALKTLRQREAAHIRSAAVTFRQQLDMQYDRLFGGACST